MLKQSTVKQPWSDKTTFYHQAFCNVAHFLFWLTGISDFKQIGPVSFQSGLGLIHLSLRHLCHAYVLNCILCINLHFAVLIYYNLFILPIWFHPSYMDQWICSTRCSFGFMLAPKCVSRKTWNTSTTSCRWTQAVVSGSSSLSVSLPGGSKWHRPNLGTVAGSVLILPT